MRQDLTRYARAVGCGLAFVVSAALAWWQWVSGATAYPTVALLPLAIGIFLLGGQAAEVVAAAVLTLFIFLQLPFGQFLETPGAGLGFLALVAIVPVALWLIRVKRTLLEMEQRLAENKAALAEQLAQRRQLEQELIAISEREQQRFGHELHDSLGQHLTGTAITAHLLAKKLQGKPEAGTAVKVVDLLDQGVELTRSLARSLYPVELEAAGLMAALEELARGTGKVARLKCTFDCPSPIAVEDRTAAMHLFRIAQEAVNNAVKHARAKSIAVRFEQESNELRLTVADDGVGLTPEQAEKPHSMGHRIMRNRAAVIGGRLEIRSRDSGGTLVSCVLPIPSA